MRTRTKRVLVFGFVALFAAALLWIVLFARSDAAIAWIAHKAVAASAGRLAIDGASGSLFGTVRFASVRFEDDQIRVTVRDVAVQASPRALLSLSADLASLTAAELEVIPKPSDSEPKPPDSLALPIAFTVHHAAVETLILVAGGDRFEVRNLSLGYRGSASGHEVRDLRAGTQFGDIRGDVALDAVRPFAIKGTVSIVRENMRFPGTLRAVLASSLERLDVALDGAIFDIKLDGTAVIAPFTANPLAQANVRAAGIDLARFDDTLAPTQLTLEVNGAGRADGTIAGALSLRNPEPGTLTAHRLPVAALDADFALKGNQLALSSLRADLGAAGAANGSATLAPGLATVDLVVRRLDLRAIHRSLRTTRLNGTIAAKIDANAQDVRAQLTEGKLRFGLDGRREGDRFVVREFVAHAGQSRLSATGAVGLSRPQRFEARARLEGFDPAAYGDFPSATLNATIAANGALAPAWRVAAHVDLAASRWRNAALSGGGKITATAETIREVDVKLRIGANVIQAQGALGQPADTLAVSIDAPQVAEIDPRVGGQARISGRLYGAFTRPGVDATVKAQGLRLLDTYRVATLDARVTLHPDKDLQGALDLKATAVTTPGVTLAAVTAKVDGNAAAHTIDAQVTATDVDMAARLAGRWQNNTWSGTVESFANRGRFPFQLTAPATVEVARDKLVVGATEAAVGDGRVVLRRLRWADGHLVSEGEFARIALAPFLALVQLPPGTSSTLVVRGAWRIDATPRLNGSVTFARESGDVVVGESPQMALELEQLELEARLVDDAVHGTAAGRSRRVGTATARFELGTVAGAAPGKISPDAPLKFDAQAEIASLRPLAALGRGGTIFDGRLAATLAGTGTLRAPKITGRVEGSALSFDMPVYGIRLANGHFAARLEGDALQLDEFAIQGGDGKLSAKGIARTGAQATTIAWRADNLRLLGRPDMRVTVDGEGTIALDEKQLVFEGALSAREGHIEFARNRGDKLGDDVEVRGRPPRDVAETRRSVPLKLALDIDLGKRFHIVGAGLETDLIGRLRVATREKGQLVGKGEIAAVRGIYFFLGQRLEIERGRLIFDGPLENPALDVRAVRRGLEVEPIVELTGTLSTPRVTLASNPPVPDGDKLAWLVLGRNLESASATDAVLLQSAAASLLENDQSIPLGRRIAMKMGLDDISLKGTGEMQGQVVTVGKRLSERLYLTFEQGFGTAPSTIGLEYLLGRGFRVRAAGGESSNVGVFFGRAWD